MTAGNFAIETHDLSKVYPNGRLGLAGLDVAIRPGEMVGILGRSGAGKTTFMRLLSGAIRPSGGSLSVLDQPLDGEVSRDQLRRLRRHLTVISQHHNVIGPLSSMQNVLMGRLGRINTWQTLRALFFVPEDERVRAAEALARVGLPDQLYQRTDQLSGGQQQRVAIARALVQEAQLLLADEPIASVDSRTAQAVLDLFRWLNQERGVTVVLNLHQVDFALQYCPRLLVLSHGKLVYDGSPDGLKDFRLYADDDGDADDAESDEVAQPMTELQSMPAEL